MALFVLSDEQRRIVESTASRLVVVAGPGTGKTSGGLMGRIERLLNEGSEPEEVMLVSFTRTAAGDLRDKLVDSGITGAEKVPATTPHSLCLRILIDRDVLALLGRRDRFLLRHELRLMLYDLDGDFGRIAEREEKLRAFEAGWLTSPGSYRADPPEPSSTKFEDQAMRWLFSHTAMLIGEVVPMAYDFLRDNDDMVMVDRVRHLLVDEYQDLNYLEQELIEFFVQQDMDLVIVGDDDQSIYGFKHAHPDGILDQANRPDSEVVWLETCRRSPQNIVAVSNTLIQHQPDRLKGPMISHSTSDGYIARVQWPRFEDEVTGIAAAIAYDVNIRDVEPGEILMLVPNRMIGGKVRDQLLELGIEARGFFDQEMFDQSLDAREALALLQLAARDSDPVAWRVLLGLGDQSGRADRYRMLCRDAIDVKQSPIDLLASIDDRHPLRRRYPKFLEIYRSVTKRLREVKDLDLDSLVDRLLPGGNDSFRELREIALSILEASDVKKPSDLLEKIMRRVSFEDVPENPSYVRVMTLHKSKGLTAQHVFILSLVEGLIPNYSRAQTAEERMARSAEARRLLYVGITRSAEELVLSSFRSLPVGEALAFGIAPPSTPARGRVNTITSSLVRELGTSAGPVLSGELWLGAYLQRAEPEDELDAVG